MYGNNNILCDIRISNDFNSIWLINLNKVMMIDTIIKK